MIHPQVRVLDDAAHLATQVAAALLTSVHQAQLRGEVPQLCLTGGRIADAVHREIARQAPRNDVDWTRVGFWWSDERWVSAEDPQRNAVQATEAFLAPLGISASQVHPMPASDSGLSLQAAANSYGAELRRAGGGVFEMLMLGVGPDAHVASLFPGFSAAEVANAIVVPVANAPKPPPLRLSLSFKAMHRSKAVWLVARTTPTTSTRTWPPPWPSPDRPRGLGAARAPKKCKPFQLPACAVRSRPSGGSTARPRLQRPPNSVVARVR